MYCNATYLKNGKLGKCRGRRCLLYEVGKRNPCPSRTRSNKVKPGSNKKTRGKRRRK